jgi:hypothetical protein
MTVFDVTTGANSFINMSKVTGLAKVAGLTNIYCGITTIKTSATIEAVADLLNTVRPFLGAVNQRPKVLRVSDPFPGATPFWVQLDTVVAVIASGIDARVITTTGNTNLIAGGAATVVAEILETASRT